MCLAVTFPPPWEQETPTVTISSDDPASPSSRRFLPVRKRRPVLIRSRFSPGAGPPALRTSSCWEIGCRRLHRVGPAEISTAAPIREARDTPGGGACARCRPSVSIPSSLLWGGRFHHTTHRSDATRPPELHPGWLIRGS